MLNSYFTFCNKQIAIFHDDIQVIVYSYSKNSQTFTGLINNKTNASPSPKVLLKKYMSIDSECIVFRQDKNLGSVNKVGTF